MGLYHYLLSRVMPWLLTPIMRGMFKDEAEARKTLVRMAKNWVEPDKRCLRPEIADLMTASLVEAFRQGAQGAAYEGTLLGGPWGFKLEDIVFPAVYLWHGEQDPEVSIGLGRTVARRIAQCTPRYYEGEGHISMIVNHADEIVTTLTRGASAQVDGASGTP